LQETLIPKINQNDSRLEKRTRLIKTFTAQRANRQCLESQQHGPTTSWQRSKTV